MPGLRGLFSPKQILPGTRHKGYKPAHRGRGGSHRSGVVKASKRKGAFGIRLTPRDDAFNMFRWR